MAIKLLTQGKSRRFEGGVALNHAYVMRFFQEVSILQGTVQVRDPN